MAGASGRGQFMLSAQTDFTIIAPKDMIRDMRMRKHRYNIYIIVLTVFAVAASGCVERRLTINTTPSEAIVVLNDQQLGRSPVTVPFNWYGDYKVRIEKEGYETLRTHRKLEGPWYDSFPFDFFAQVLYPEHIVDTYQWDFELAEQDLPSRQQILEQAQKTRKRVSQWDQDARMRIK